MIVACGPPFTLSKLYTAPLGPAESARKESSSARSAGVSVTANAAIVDWRYLEGGVAMREASEREGRKREGKRGGRGREGWEEGSRGMNGGGEEGKGRGLE